VRESKCVCGNKSTVKRKAVYQMNLTVTGYISSMLHLLNLSDIHSPGAHLEAFNRGTDPKAIYKICL
jgi:hypothetical protein